MVSNKENGHALIASITSFVNMLLEGNCRYDVIPFFFGGRLIALKKKSGDIRSIDYTLRRIAAKCANNFALIVLGNKLLPEQLGFSCPGGCEAAVYATLKFISNMPATPLINSAEMSYFLQ